MCRKALARFDNVVYFGTCPDNHFVIKEIDLHNDFSSFCMVSDKDDLGKFTIQTHGRHNVLNSAAAILCSYLDGIDKEIIREGIYSYTGVGRRFEYKGEKTESGYMMTIYTSSV